MKSSQKMMIAFLLNLSFAIIEVIFGLAFNSSAVLADAVHDTGDALAIGLSTLLKKKIAVIHWATSVTVCWEPF